MLKKFFSIVLSLLLGILIGTENTRILLKKEIEKKQDDLYKYTALFLMLNQWIRTKQEQKSIVRYLENRNYKKIAIYGLSHVGETLVEELKNTEIEVVYGIDKNTTKIFPNLNILIPDDKLEEVDAIIVTAIYYMEEIYSELSKKVSCPIISLEDIIFEL